MSNGRFLPVRKTAIRRATEMSFGQAKIESTTLHVMGIAVAAISLGMFVGALVEWGSTNRDTAALLISGTLALVAGGLLWWVTVPGTVRARDVFSAVGWTWLVVTLVGAVPYLLGGTFDVPGIDRSGQFVNAIFESASGYSATGSTSLTDFEHPGRGMMMHRQITQWYGGMGMVVIAVAVLPFLGVGGMDLMSAEAPGPSGDRLTPRVSETAKRLWFTYVLFTVGVSVTLIAIPGPSVYDAIAHGLTTIATGGFLRTLTPSEPSTVVPWSWRSSSAWSWAERTSPCTGGQSWRPPCVLARSRVPHLPQALDRSIRPGNRTALARCRPRDHRSDPGRRVQRRSDRNQHRLRLSAGRGSSGDFALWVPLHNSCCSF